MKRFLRALFVLSVLYLPATVHAATPVVTTTTGTTVFTVGQTAVVVDPGITVTDDGGNISSATVSIANKMNMNEILSATTTGYPAIMASYNLSSGVLTLTGTDTAMHYQAVLQTVKYNNTTTPSPNTALRRILFTAKDGTAQSTAAEKQVSYNTGPPPNAAPVLNVTALQNTMFTIGQGPVVVDNGVTLTDDSGIIGAARIYFMLHDGSAESLSVDTLGYPISVTIYNTSGTTFSLNLDGNATAQQYQNVLRTVTYNNTSQSPTGSGRTIYFSAEDANYLGTPDMGKNIVFQAPSTPPSNAAPVVTTSAGTTAFTKGQAAVAVDPGVTVSDDGGVISSATVTISNLLNGTSESLSAATSGTITSSYNSSTGVLTLSGSDTTAGYQSVLRTVLYNNTSASPNTTTRIIQYGAFDGSLAGTASKLVSIVTPTVTSPVISTRSGTTAFTGQGAVNVDGGLQISSSDSLTGATVRIANLLDGASESLSVSTSGYAVTASYSSSTGILTITGTEPECSYSNILRAVKYNNTKTPPDPTTRSIEFTVSVGSATSAVATRLVSMPTAPPSNTAPVVTTSAGTTAFTKGQAAVAVDPGVTVGDDGGIISSATVTISNLLNGASESLAATTTGSLITATYNSASGVLILAGSDTIASYQTVLRSVRYNNSSTSPNTTTRTIQFGVSDGWLAGTASKLVSIVTPTVASPTVTTSAGTTAFKGQAVTVDTGVRVSSSSSLTGATVRIANLLDGASESLSVSTSYYSVTANYDSSTGVLTITGNEPECQYSNLLGTVKYNNTKATPSQTTRSIEFTVSVGSATSAIAAKLVSMPTATPPSSNTAPVVITTAGTTAFTKGQGAVVVDAGVTASDDSGIISSATVSITNLLNGVSENLSVDTAGYAMTASYNAATGVLSLSGADTAANYTRVLRKIAYNNTSTSPNTTTRSIKFSLSDGTVASGAAFKYVSITVPPAPPVVTTTNGTTVFKGQGAVVVDGGVRVSSYNKTTAAVVRISNLLDGASESLSVNTSGYSVTASYDAAAGMLTITGAEPDCQFSHILEYVKYNNTSANPDTTTRSIQFTVYAGTQASVPAVKQVSFLTVQTAPRLDLSMLSDEAVTSGEVVNVAGKATATSGIASVTINGVPAAVSSGFFDSAVLLSAGTNTVVVAAKDMNGVLTSAVRRIFHDKTAPEMTVTVPADNSTTITNLLTVAGTTGDPQTRIDIVVNNGTPQAAVISGVTYTASVTLVPGINTIEITATDIGNRTNRAKRTVLYDAQGVTLAITGPGEDELAASESYIIRGMIADAPAGSGVSLDFDGQTFTPAVTEGLFEQPVTLSAQKLYAITVTGMDTMGIPRSVARRNLIYGVPQAQALDVSLTADLPSPQVVGTQVTFRADATGGNGNYEYEFLRNAGGIWSTMQAYSATHSWTWDTSQAAAGVYTVQVRVRTAGTAVPYNVLKSISYTVKLPPVVTATLMSNVSSPQNKGNVVTFTAEASGGTESYEFQFRRYFGGTWTVVQEYSSLDRWVWDTGNSGVGVYTIQVRVRNAGSSKAYEIQQSMMYTIKLPAVADLRVAADLQSPQVRGAKVLFTGEGVSGSGSYEYEFRLKAAGAWTVVRPYGIGNTWMWDTTDAAAGPYTVQVRVRNTGAQNNYDVAKSLPFTINLPPITAVTLTPDVVGPAVRGTAVTFTAEGMGGTGNCEYEFRVNSGGVSTVVQNYSAVNTWIWETGASMAGKYSVVVRARNAGETAYIPLSLGYTLK